MAVGLPELLLTRYANTEFWPPAIYAKWVAFDELQALRTHRPIRIAAGKAANHNSEIENVAFFPGQSFVIVESRDQCLPNLKITPVESRILCCVPLKTEVVR